jgi:peptidoglycan-associated lipoprotein
MFPPEAPSPIFRHRRDPGRRWARGCVIAAVCAAAMAGCRTPHRPVSEVVEFGGEEASGEGVRPAKARAEAPHEAIYPEENTGSSTGIVVLRPAVARGDLPAEPGGETEAVSGNEAEVLLIRETWPNPVARESAGAVDVGIRLEPVRFAYDSTLLDFAARRRLGEYAGWLAENPGVSVTLEGHCDDRGSAEYNYSLGMSRAWSVREALIGLGVEADRLYPISYGEEQPIATGRSAEARALNRRVELRPFYPSREGGMLVSFKEAPGPPEAREAEETSPARFALSPEEEGAAWPAMSE